MSNKEQFTNERDYESQEYKNNKLSAEDIKAFSNLKTTTMKQENNYLLFGDVAVQTLLCEGITSLMDLIVNKEVDYQLYIHTPKDCVTDLLFAYDGWDGYSSITFEQYNLIINLI